MNTNLLINTITAGPNQRHATAYSHIEGGREGEARLFRWPYLGLDLSFSDFIETEIVRLTCNRLTCNCCGGMFCKRMTAPVCPYIYASLCPWITACVV